MGSLSWPEEPSSAIVDDFLTHCDEPLLISEFAAAEVASALSRLARAAEERGVRVRLV